MYLILEYVNGGTLFDLCEIFGTLDELSSRFLIGQVFDSLAYLNRAGVVHRDLKLENILVDNDLNLKLADFGFATYKNIRKLKSFKGTKTYMAPEIKE